MNILTFTPLFVKTFNGAAFFTPHTPYRNSSEVIYHAASPLPAALLMTRLKKGKKKDS